MKSTYLTVCLLCSTLIVVAQQWDGSPTVDGSIFRNGNISIGPNGYIDDDNVYGEHLDDWIRFRGYIELKSNTDSHGIVLRDKESTQYLSITQKNGWSYFADTQSSGNYFLRGNGRNVQIGGKLDLYDRLTLTSKDNTFTELKVTSYNGTSNGGPGSPSPVMWMQNVGGTSAAPTATKNDLLLGTNTYGGHDGTQNVQIARISVWTTGDWTPGNYPARMDFKVGGSYPCCGNTRMSIDGPTGNVGIGTETPTDRLQVEKNGNTFLQLVNTGTNGSMVRLGPVNSNGKVETQLQFAEEFGMFDHSANEWRVKVLNDGKVGIGTTTPSETLHINGNIRGHKNGAIRISTGTGYVEVGPKNSSYSHFVTDRSKFYFNKELRVNSGLIGSHDEDLRLRASGLTGITIKNSTANVGIGTTNPTEKLTVAGTAYAQEVRVEVAAGTGPDYVFEPDYNLPSLEAVEKFIRREKHLPEIPTAKEMEENGVKVGEMNMLLLKKIEELTLYQIDLLEMLKKQQLEIDELKNN